MFGIMPSEAFAMTLTVCQSGCSSTSIQGAIDAASSGDTIQVTAGQYAESILIGKTLTLVGSGTVKPVISGVDASHNYIVKITANNVKFDTFEVNGGGVATGNNAFDYGILVTGVSSAEISNCVIKNIWKVSSSGIQIDSSSTGSNIHNNLISSFQKTGIKYIKSAGTFHDNEVVGDNVDGTSRVQNDMNIWGGSNVEIYGNILRNALTVSDVTPTWISPAVLVTGYNTDGSAIASTANIHDNQIYDDDTGVDVGSAYTGNTRDGTVLSNAIITNNIFHHVNTAVNFEQTSATATITHNSFGANIAKVLDTQNLSGPLPTSPVITATNNWWGTAVSSTLALKIGSSVTVTYVPYYVDSALTILNTVIPNTVYVNSTYTDGHAGTYIFGYNAFTKIQDGINAVASGGTVNVAAGSYSEALTITKVVTLLSSNSNVNPNTGSRATEAIITGSMSVNSPNVSVKGFTLTNPNGNNVITVNGVSNIQITNNIIHDVGVTANGAVTATGSVQAIYINRSSSIDISGIMISDNTISHIRSSGAGSGKSIKAIFIGDSTGTKNIGATVTGNTISDIISSGWGAYGILVNHATSSIGMSSVDIENNNISNLSGTFAHAIGLEGNTPNAKVIGNTVSTVIDSDTPNAPMR